MTGARTKARSAALWIAVLAWSTSWPAAGYRPFDSTDASVAAVGVFEVELGPVGFVRSDGHSFLVVPGMIANLGFAPRWEVVLQARHFVRLDDDAVAARSRLRDTGAFLKGVLRDGTLNGSTGPSIAIELGAILPTVNDDPGYGALVAGIVSYRVPALTLHVNGAASLSRAHRFDAFGGLIVEGPDAWTVRPVAEVYLEKELEAAFTVSGLVGAIWRARPWLSVDVALRVARVNGDTVLETRAGLTIAMNLWRRP